MKKPFLFGILTLTALFASCGNDEENDPGNQLNNQNYCDYAPYSVGSTFTYENKTKDQFTGEYQTSITTNEVVETTEYQGKTWAVIAGQVQFGDEAEGLARCDEAGVTLLAKSLEVNGQLITDYEFPVLKFPATPGKTWQSEPLIFDVMGFTNKVYYTFEVTGANLTQTVAGATYDEVLEITEETFTEVDGFPPISSALTYRYYDQEVGLIKSVILAQGFFGNDTLTVSELIDYEIQ